MAPPKASLSVEFQGTAPCITTVQFAQQTSTGPHYIALAPTGHTLKLRGAPLVHPASQKVNADPLPRNTAPLIAVFIFVNIRGMEIFSSFLENHYGAVLDLIENIVVSLIIGVLGVAATRVANRLLKKAAFNGLLVDDTVARILRRIVRYGIFVICVIMILTTFGINTASLLAVLGAAGVAVGLALKDTLGNIAAGIILLLLGSYRRGEYIEFGSYSGTVKEISLFTTTFETPDGIFISAPNSCIWGTPVKNYSRYGRRRMEFPVSLSYSDSIDTAFRVMRNIAEAETRFMKEPAPQVILQSLGENSVNIALRAWASTGVYWDIYWDQMKNIKLKLEEAGLHIALPRRDVRLTYVAGKD